MIKHGHRGRRRKQEERRREEELEIAAQAAGREVRGARSAASEDGCGEGKGKVRKGVGARAVSQRKLRYRKVSYT